jgi:hypothetical protein
MARNLVFAFVSFSLLIKREEEEKKNEKQQQKRMKTKKEKLEMKSCNCSVHNSILWLN